MTELRDKLFCAMSPAQEEGYMLASAERILRYQGLFLLTIIGIQIYNLTYTLIYTGWRLHTVPSRVYAVFYVALLLISVAGLFMKNYLKKNLPKQARSTVRLQVLYGCVLLAWAVCVTVYDQRVSNNVSVYLTVALTVAVVIHFKPVQAVATYVFFLIVMILVLPVFQVLPTDNYGNYVNVSVMTLMSVIISAYHYALDRRQYLGQQTILEQNSLLAEVAARDALTRLRNRRFLDEKMDGLYQQCAETGDMMTVMMIDIDHFKNYNDTYGHQQGDECLRRMAWRLEQELDAESEYLIRYGGEEFLYIGIGVDGQMAEEKGRRFHKVIRELVIGPSDQDQRGITISIGICSRTPGQGQPWSEYIAEADRALYRAKNSGRDRWVTG